MNKKEKIHIASIVGNVKNVRKHRGKLIQIKPCLYVTRVRIPFHKINWKNLMGPNNAKCNQE